MTTQLRELFERNGYSPDELEGNEAFEEFCTWLTTVDLLSQKLVQYGVCDQRSSKRIARALHRHCEKTSKKNAPPDDELHFKPWWSRLLISQANKELTDTVHGFGDRGAQYLDSVLFRMWLNFATRKTLS
ncbi:MAG TPA: hypothetical protein VJ246_04025 [Patescibacteria group bacterium]|nr:hypothetical protein [Patescibacteria group bacterium]